MTTAEPPYGEPLDFEVFYTQSYSRVLARALMISVNRHDAEDAVQDAYAELLGKWDKVSRYEAPEAWLHVLVRQRLWKTSRRWWRRVSLVTVELDAWQSTIGNPERAVLANTVLAAIATLPFKQRVVMEMHCVEGIPQHEIAAELRRSPVTVATTIHKARKALRKKLGTSGGQDLLGQLVPRNATGRDSIEAVLVASCDWLARHIAGHAPGRDRIRRNVAVRAAGTR